MFTELQLTPTFFSTAQRGAELWPESVWHKTKELPARAALRAADARLWPHQAAKGAAWMGHRMVGWGGWMTLGFCRTESSKIVQDWLSENRYDAYGIAISSFRDIVN